jgi:hypothetical protein
MARLFNIFKKFNPFEAQRKENRRHEEERDRHRRDFEEKHYGKDDRDCDGGYWHYHD